MTWPQIDNVTTVAGGVEIIGNIVIVFGGDTHDELGDENTGAGEGAGD